MRLDIYSDTICPWCYIGKRRLERALAMRPNPEMTIRWRTFQLNPAMAAGGMERRAYLAAKFGGTGRAQRLYQAVGEAGLSEGIPFAFERIERTPNTLDSHRLLRLAATLGRQDETLEALFRAYFVEGRDIGDRGTLESIGAEAGLDRAVVRRFLAGDEESETAMAEDVLARRHGISGVPYFVFNGRYSLSGAQEPEALVQLFDLAREADLFRGEAPERA